MKVTDTDTTKRISPQKLLINWNIPVIIPPIKPPIADGVAAGRGNAHSRHTIALNAIVADAGRSVAHVFQDSGAVNRKDMDRTIPQDGNTSRIPPILNSPVMIGGGTSVSPTRTGSQEISSPSGTIGPVEVRKAQPFHTFIN